MPSRRALTDAFIVVFLLVQGLLPLRGIVLDKFQSRADFTWNMYAKKWSCRVDYDVVTATGRRIELSHRDYFWPRKKRAMKVYHEDSLQWFHAYLCDRVAASRTPGRLLGDVECSLNFGEYRPMVVSGVDLCTAENYGVIDQ